MTSFHHVCCPACLHAHPPAELVLVPYPWAQICAKKRGEQKKIATVTATTGPQRRGLHQSIENMARQKRKGIREVSPQPVLPEALRCQGRRLGQKRAIEHMAGQEGEGKTSKKHRQRDRNVRK